MIIPKSIRILCVAACVTTGCSYEDHSNKAKEAAETVFLDASLKPDYQTETIKLYLPEDFIVAEESENNFILEKSGNPYILFVNPHENRKSRTLYTTVKQLNDKDIELANFEDQESFGFIAIRDLDEKKYEVSVGVGGVKLTTETSEKKLSDEAAQMMTIVDSITQKK